MKQYEDNGYKVTEFDNGAVIREMIPNTEENPMTVEVTPQPTLEDKVNYLYYKSMGVI